MASRTFAVGARPAGVTMMVALLALAIFINYVDRGNLATAGPLIKTELNLSNTEFGLLVSAFFWTYTPAQLVAGWLAQRFNTYAVMGWGLALWALATIATGLAGSLAALLALRLLLGLGESVAFPCSSKLIAQHVSSEKLGFANAQLAVGLSLGPAFGVFFGGLVMAQYGWRSSFVLFGVISLIWLLPWRKVQRAVACEAGPSEDRSPPLLAIARHRSAWGAGIGHFCINYAWYFVLAWLPLFLVKERGFSMTEMAQIGGMIYLLQAVSSIVFGRLSDRWIAAGATPTRARKTMMIAGALITAACLVVAGIGDGGVAIGALLLSGAFGGLTASNLYAVGQTLAGPAAAGKWIGWQNFIGNLAGIVAPALTGYIVDQFDGFGVAFAMAAAISAAGGLSWAFIVGRVAPIDWGPRAPVTARRG
jgi:MFS family permease